MSYAAVPRVLPRAAWWLPWGVAFLILNLVVTHDGNTNAMSRWCTMRSMLEQGSFRIDDSLGDTVDWARTPDGHYYSNKAPGPMLLGFPVFAIVDQIPRLWEQPRDAQGLRPGPSNFTKKITCLLIQQIPLLCLVAAIVQWLQQRGVSRAAQTFFLMATLWGNTASLFFNNNCGHGFTAILTLATLYSLLRGSFFAVGLFAGAALLSDYGFGMQIPALLLCVGCRLQSEQHRVSNIARFLLGGVGPGLLWIWYHTACFGSPVSIANHYQNPAFLDTAHEQINLWGIFRLPPLETFRELLFGGSRGILLTQPWVYLSPLALCLPFVFSSRASRIRAAPDRRLCTMFCVLSLGGLLLMNASFGGWHGGGSAGPRYLCAIFPCFALWTALDYDHWYAPLWICAWMLLAVAVLFRGLAFSCTILAPCTPLWPFYLSEIARPRLTAELRLLIYAAALTGAWAWQHRHLKESWLSRLSILRERRIS